MFGLVPELRGGPTGGLTPLFQVLFISPLITLMTRPGENACRRACQGLSPLKRGKKSWVFGTKLKFFSSRKDTWVTASAGGKDKLGAGKFYDKMAKLYMKKYGEMDWMDDLEEDTEDTSEDDLNDSEEVENLDEEEAERRSKFFRELRSVSFF